MDRIDCAEDAVVCHSRGPHALLQDVWAGILVSRRHLQAEAVLGPHLLHATGTQAHHAAEGVARRPLRVHLGREAARINETAAERSLSRRIVGMLEGALAVQGKLLHVFWHALTHFHRLRRVVSSHHGVTAAIDPVDCPGPGAERLFGVGGRHAFHGRVCGKNAVADLAACLADVVRDWLRVQAGTGGLPVP